MVDSHFHAMARKRQTDEARNVLALRLEIQQQREAARRKAVPISTPFDDPKFCERVVARATRHARAARQLYLGISNKPKPTVSARQRWNNAVDAKVATGIPKAQAIMAADKQNPELRQKLIAEANSKR